MFKESALLIDSIQHFPDAAGINNVTQTGGKGVCGSEQQLTHKALYSETCQAVRGELTQFRTCMLHIMHTSSCFL